MNNDNEEQFKSKDEIFYRKKFTELLNLTVLNRQGVLKL